MSLLAPVGRDEARRLLAESSAIEASADVMDDIAEQVGFEAPALRWAGTLARVMGWSTVLERLRDGSQLSKLGPLPWSNDVERLLEAAPPTARELLATLAACDAPFSWDVAEAVCGTLAIEDICWLEESGLLFRRSAAGVVLFEVPFAVRAMHRRAGGTEARAEVWRAAWAVRVATLRASSYGPNARAALAELAAAIPLAAIALLSSTSETPSSMAEALAVWVGAADAIFFADAIVYASPAFVRAVGVADAVGDVEARVRTRLIAARAAFECGDPDSAESLLEEAASMVQSDPTPRDELRSETWRGIGWAMVASARLDRAREAFEAAAASANDARGEADAAAGRGITALLEGDPVTASALFAEALAVHVVTRDAPREAAVRGMMMLLPDRRDAPEDEAALAREVTTLRTSGQRWREALALARLGLAARARGDAEAERTCLLEARAAAALSRMPASALAAAATESGVEIHVGFEGRTLAIASGTTDLSKHGALRRMLWELALARKTSPGVPLTTNELIERAWPGDKAKHEAALLRVYTTVRRLRALGLGDALLTRDDGYLLDPAVTLRLDAS